MQSIDRKTALDILRCIDRFLALRIGDVKKLNPPFPNLRLRCGDYRIFFNPDGEAGIDVVSVKHRSFAYR